MNNAFRERKRDSLEYLDRFLPPFFESTQINLAFFDPDFNFLMVNPAYLAGTGLTSGEILGRNHFELYPNPENQAFFEQVRDSGEPASFSERPFVHPHQPWQRSTLWDGTLTPLLSREGETLGLALSLVDATDRVRESQLREALDEIIFSIQPDGQLDATLERMMKKSAAAVGADAAVIIMQKGKQWLVRSAHCFPEGFVHTAFKAEDLPYSARVMKQKRALLIADASGDPESTAKVFAGFHPDSLLVVPLEARGRIMGLVYFSSMRPYAFDDLHLNFARSLCAVYNLTLNSPILLASLNLELKKGSLLQQITAVSSDKRDLPDFCLKVLEIMNSHLKLLNGGFLTLSPDGRSIQLQAAIGLSDEVVADLRDVPREKTGYITNVALDRDKVVTHKQDPLTPIRQRKLKTFGLENSRYVSGPIRNRDQVLGVFIFSFEGRRDFTEDEMNIFKSVGSILGPVMHNVILLQNERRQRETALKELETTNLFLQLSATLAQSLVLDDVLQAVIEASLKAVPDCRVTISLIDLERRLVETKASGGIDPVAQSTLPLDDLSAAYTRLLDTGETVIFDYAGAELSPLSKSLVEKYRLCRTAMVPLSVSGRMIGHIYVDEPGRARDFSSREIELLEGIALQAAVTIDNAHLHQKANDRSKTFEAILQMGGLITASLKRGEALNQIIEYSLLLLDVPSATLLMPDESGRQFDVVASEGLPRYGAKSRLSADQVNKLELESGHPVVLEDLKALDGITYFRNLSRAGFVSAAATSIFIEGEMVGLLMVQDKKRMFLSNELLKGFRLFANQAAISIRNSQIFETEFHIAETLQKSLLPVNIPRIKGLDFRFVFRSASKGALVGGDFYDYFDLGGGRFCFVAGDVAGKGIEAATETARVKYLIRDRAYAGLPPQEILRSINRTLYQQEIERFTALTLCLYDAGEACLEVSCAGNPYPMLAESGAAVEMDSLLLSVSEDYEYQVKRIELAKNETFLMFTDGLTEARRGQRLFGAGKLQSVIRKNHLLPLGSLLKRITAEAEEFTGGDLSDDMLIMGLRKK